jgi:hypothetical protein
MHPFGPRVWGPHDGWVRAGLRSQVNGRVAGACGCYEHTTRPSIPAMEEHPAPPRNRHRPGLREREHPTDCVRGLPMTQSAVRGVHAVLAGAFRQAQVWGWGRPRPDGAGHSPSTGRH